MVTSFTGRSNDRAAHVGYDGWVAAYGYGVAIYDGCVGIRPALYLNLTNSVYRMLEQCLLTERLRINL